MSIEDPDFPYDKKTQVQMKGFFDHISGPTKKRDKFLYKRSDEGNLEIYDIKTNQLVSSIPLYYYRPYSKEEFETIEKKRLESIIEIETNIDIQKDLLRKAHSNKDKSEIIKINEDIHNLELKKTSIRSPIRDIKIIFEPEIRSIMMNEPYEKRKMESVYQTIYRDFPLWKLYGKYTDSREILEASEQEKIVLEEGQVFLTNGSIARLIYEPGESINGLLSIYLFKNVVYNDTQYSSAYQAFEAERLKELGYDELRNNILKTRAIKAIRFTAQKIQKPMKNTKVIWKDILTKYYEQNPDLIDNLLKTKNDILVFNTDVSYLGGIGISSGLPESTNINLWKTFNIDNITLKPNIIGEVLNEIRSEMKEKTVDERVKVGGAPKERSKTEEDIMKSKKASIINYYKNH